MSFNNCIIWNNIGSAHLWEGKERRGKDKVEEERTCSELMDVPWTCNVIILLKRSRRVWRKEKKGWNGWRSKGVDELRAGWEASIERVRKDERRGKQMEPEGGCSDFIYSLVLPPRPLWQAEKNLADWSKSHSLHTRHWQMACEVHSPQLFLFMRPFRRWEYYLSSGTAWCVLTLTPSVYLWLTRYSWCWYQYHCQGVWALICC